jgi:hypothetical protein
MTADIPKYSPEAEATIEEIVRRARAIAGCPLFGDHGKNELVAAVKRDLAYGWKDDRLVIAADDMCVFDLRVDAGVADMVVVHADRSVTVIALRNGDEGVEHVGTGMRAVAVLAAQVGAKCLAPSTRTALLWSSCGDPGDDAVIEVLCERAGIIPLPHGSLAVLAAVPTAVQDVLAGRAT